MTDDTRTPAYFVDWFLGEYGIDPTGEDWSRLRDALADDVRYANGGGTSDYYWRGFNDGINALVAHLREAR